MIAERVIAERVIAGRVIAARATRLDSPTARALLGASAAMTVGLAIGGLARAARAGGGTPADGVGALVARSAPAQLAAALVSAATSLSHRYATRQTIAVALLALVIVVALGAALRAVTLWRRERRTSPRPTMRFTLRRWVSAGSGELLVASEAHPADVARRTGLSRDAIALAAHLRG